MKVSFKRRKISKVFMTHVQVFFRKSLSKATFERKLSSVSLALVFLSVLFFLHLYVNQECRLVVVATSTYTVGKATHVNARSQYYPSCNNRRAPWLTINATRWNQQVRVTSPLAVYRSAGYDPRWEWSTWSDDQSTPVTPATHHQSLHFRLLNNYI